MRIFLVFIVLLAACSSPSPPPPIQAENSQSRPGCKLPIETLKAKYAEEKWPLIRLTGDQVKAMTNLVPELSLIDDIYVDKDVKDEGEPVYLVMFFSKGCAVAFVTMAPNFFEGLISGT